MRKGHSTGKKGRYTYLAERTTIVGGRPPGPDKGVGSVPRGIEVLTKKAAVDPEFRALLLAERSAAPAAIGLELSEAEVAILESVHEAQLKGIIANTTVNPKLRPAFMGKAAAVMLAALGVVTVTGCTMTFGNQPDDPGDWPPITGPEPEDRVTEPDGNDESTSGDRGQPSAIDDPAAGIRPDIPPVEPEAVTNNDGEPASKQPELLSISGDGGYEISNGKVIIHSTPDDSDVAETTDE